MWEFPKLSTSFLLNIAYIYIIHINVSLFFDSSRSESERKLTKLFIFYITCIYAYICFLNNPKSKRREKESTSVLMYKCTVLWERPTVEPTFRAATKYGPASAPIKPGVGIFAP